MAFVPVAALLALAACASSGGLDAEQLSPAGGMETAAREIAYTPRIVGALRMDDAASN